MIATFLVLFYFYKTNLRYYPSATWFSFALLGILPIVCDIASVNMNLRETNNQFRLITGMVFGISVACLLFPFCTNCFYFLLEVILGEKKYE